MGFGKRKYDGVSWCYYLIMRMNPIPLIHRATEFAPAERVTAETVRQQAAIIARQPLVAELLNSVLNYVLILNPQRQIVFASKNVQELVPDAELPDMLGQRPGEALGCVHPDPATGGCGTTAFCRECGAVKSILTSLAGRRDCQECRMIRVTGAEQEAMDLLVACTPLKVEGETYSLAAIADISHEKRRRALERIFFHDVINSAGSLEGRVMLMQRGAPGDINEQVQLLGTSVHHVVEEIVAQRDLVAAENNELAVDRELLKTREVLEKVVRMYADHPAARDRSLRVAPESTAQEFTSDPRLLRRVLGNMIKNALEAAHAGHVVTAGCGADGDNIRFWVHNPTFMPPNVQLQIFNRSFSTKGSGRGLGTYSIKLLTDRYLKGRAGFTTAEEDGTTFYVILPQNLVVTRT